MTAAIILAACSDQNQPAAPAPDSPADLARAQGQGDNANALARSVPGFGGFFYDAQARPPCT